MLSFCKGKMAAKRAKVEEEPSVAVFREYLRIKTVQPNPDYGKCNVLTIFNCFFTLKT